MAVAITIRDKEDYSECRLCGTIAKIKIDINDQIKGSNCCKDYVEFFCRIEIHDFKNLSNGVCEVCYGVLLGFCKFTLKVENHQTTLKNRQAATQCDKTISLSSSNSSENLSASNNSLKSSCSSTTNNNSEHQTSRSSKRPRNAKNYREEESDDEESVDCSSDEESRESTPGKSFENKRAKICATTKAAMVKDCLIEVQKLFNTKSNGNQEKHFERISIKKTLMLKDGEIPKSWLSRYQNSVTWRSLWQRTSHSCKQCPKKLKTFDTLLNHLNDPKHSSSSLKCRECKKNFDGDWYVARFINHVATQHLKHLKFGCIFCNKVYCDTKKLSKHLTTDHGDVNFNLYPCFNCGILCPTLELLAQHKTCHDD